MCNKNKNRDILVITTSSLSRAIIPKIEYESEGLDSQVGLCQIAEEQLTETVNKITHKVCSMLWSVTRNKLVKKGNFCPPPFGLPLAQQIRIKVQGKNFISKLFYREITLS